MTRRIAIFISGRGSNMETLVRALEGHEDAGKVALVLSNKASAAGLTFAEGAGLPTAVVSHKGLTREAFEAKVEDHLAAAEIDLICLAGFMRVLSESFSKRWSGRVLNIHPSLLPSFRGLHVHEQALKAGVAVSGCTVHWVTPELDGGPIVGQAVVPVEREDTPDTLAARVQKAEHILYPAALFSVLGIHSDYQQTDDMIIALR
ncbi:MAG: phosphoribosylglycinamide formyltransferase [Pseudomonadota bacterium]